MDVGEEDADADADADEDADADADEDEDITAMRLVKEERPEGPKGPDESRDPEEPEEPVRLRVSVSGRACMVSNLERSSCAVGRRGGDDDVNAECTGVDAPDMMFA